MQSWRPRTRSQYASRLQALAAYAERTGPPDPAATLAGLLAERAQAGATASALRGIISAIRAVEDLQWLPPTVTTLHKRIAAGAASSGSQPYLSPAGMVQLVERARDSRNGTVFSALAIISWVCYLRVGEAAGIRVSDLAMAGFVQFSKQGRRGTPPGPSTGMRTGSVRGFIATWYHWAGRHTCWSGSRVRRDWRQAWPRPWRAQRTPALGGMRYAGAAPQRLGPASQTSPTTSGGADGRARPWRCNTAPSGPTRGSSPLRYCLRGPVTEGLCRLRSVWASWRLGFTYVPQHRGRTQHPDQAQAEAPAG